MGLLNWVAFTAHAQAVQGPIAVARQEGSSLPLRPTRVGRFQVTEGTWMSLDVAPDGRSIVFDLLGDLFTVSIEGGQAVQITSGTAINHQPRYSPDGRYLVFISDRGGSENVWIADRDGRHARQLSQLHGTDGSGAVTSPTWSPDGRLIVVSQRPGAARERRVSRVSNDQWLLAAYDVATGRMRYVSDTAPQTTRSALGATFQRQGPFLYAAVDAFGQPPWMGLNWWVARIDMNDGRIQPEMSINAGRVGMRPAVSPDGLYLAYASSSGTRVGLRVRDLRTDQERWLVREALDDPPLRWWSEARDLIPGYAFTPDSRSVIIAYCGKIHRIDLATGRISVIPFRADVVRWLGPLGLHQFTLTDNAVRTRSVMQPAISPDGSRVAFSALDRIWVMELPHNGRPVGQPRRATADSVGEFYPSWSPDGTWLAYSTWQDGKGGTVRRVSAESTLGAATAPPQQLTSDSALYFHTAVDPHGKSVVAVRAPAPPELLLSDQTQLGPLYALKPALVALPVFGGSRRIVASLAALYSPWLRYPLDQVYFGADSNCIYVGLTCQRWDRAEQRSILGVVGREKSGGEIGPETHDVIGVLAPDGRRALVTRKYTLFELSLPRVDPQHRKHADTLDLDAARTQPFGSPGGPAHRWGRVLAPWVSWSRNGRRVLFNQGGTLLLGDVRPDGWTVFKRVDVPLQVPVDIPRGTLVLHGARILTMRGDEVIEEGDLVVRDNRIAAVGPVGRVAIPSGARILDVPGTTIIPGYVDVHDHPLLPKGLHAGQCWPCLAALAYGVTASRDPQATLDNDVFTYRERERNGDLISPRIFSTGIPYHGTDPPVRTLKDAHDAVQPHARFFDSETFKIYYDGATDRFARQLLTVAATEYGLNATAHTNGLALALVSAVDGLSGAEHAPDIRIYDDVATLIARTGTTWTQTYSGTIIGSLVYMVRRYGDPMEQRKMRRFVPPSARAGSCYGCPGDRIPAYSPPELDDLQALLTGAAQIVARGGRVAIGSHGNMPGLGYHYEMWLHALGGMPNQEILRSATIAGASAIGHANDLGSLEPGKLADLQVLEQNPLDDIRHSTSIRYVMKNGRLYRAEDLTETWPRYKTLESSYLWEREEPDSALTGMRMH